MEYDLGAIKNALRYRNLYPPATPEEVRARIDKCLSELGVDLAGAPAAPADGPGHALVLWASDNDDSIAAYAIPDAAIGEAQRAALAEVPFCFAEAGDCEAAQWWAAVRVMAALGSEDLDAASFYQIMVEENLDLADEAPAPARQELVDGFGAWATHRAVDLCRSDELSWLGRRFTGFYAYNKAV